jgi:hypothetical protein
MVSKYANYFHSYAKLLNDIMSGQITTGQTGWPEVRIAAAMALAMMISGSNIIIEL